VLVLKVLADFNFTYSGGFSACLHLGLVLKQCGKMVKKLKYKILELIISKVIEDGKILQLSKLIHGD
jgi:hypothetical protein